MAQEEHLMNPRRVSCISEPQIRVGVPTVSFLDDDNPSPESLTDHGKLRPFEQPQL